MHGRIEKVCGRQPVYTVEQYKDLIVSAKVDGEPYELKEITKDDIYDFKILFHSLEERGLNMSKDTDNVKVKWNSIKEIQVCSGDVVEMFIKYSHNDEALKKVLLMTDEMQLADELSDIQLQLAYNGPRRIPVSKMRDIMRLSNHVVPPQHRQFYEDLQEANASIVTDVESDADDASSDEQE